MGSILSLPQEAQGRIGANLGIGGCISFSVALGRPSLDSSGSGIAPGLLPYLQVANLPAGHQPSFAVYRELSGVTSLEFEGVKSLDLGGFCTLERLKQLKVGKRGFSVTLRVLEIYTPEHDILP